MKSYCVVFCILFMAMFAGAMAVHPENEEIKMNKSIYDFTITNNVGDAVSMSNYTGKVLLIVNTASKCGFTPQYKGLEALYEKYKDQGLVVIGFPCNQFAGQEPGTDSEIADFCELNYGVTFPLMSKVNVNGKHAAPLYVFLKEQVAGDKGRSEAIKWNFAKFLVSRDGTNIQRFGSRVKPEELKDDIEKLLKEDVRVNPENKK